MDFDLALAAFGITVQNRLDDTDKEGNRKHTIDTALGLPMRPKPIKNKLLRAHGVLNKG